MRNITRKEFIALCALLSLSGCKSGQQGGKGGGSSVQMFDFNKDLAPVAKDDFYRTT